MRAARWLVPVIVAFALACASTAPAHSAQIKRVEAKLHKATSVVNFYNGKGRWALHMRTPKCWMLRHPKRVRICRTARENLRWHLAQVPKLRHRIRVLNAPPGMSAGAAGWWAGSGPRCVKSEEAGWAQGSYYAPGGVPKYWGGFQADTAFMSAYGRKYLRYYGWPTAYRRGDGVWVWTNPWPVGAQIEMAYRGHRARGWWPWPRTARLCGLL